jgi:hypothetical protein
VEGFPEEEAAVAEGEDGKWKLSGASRVCLRYQDNQHGARLQKESVLYQGTTLVGP